MEGCMRREGLSKLLLLIGILVLLTGCQSTTPPGAPTWEGPDESESYVPDELLIQYRLETTAETQGSLEAKFGLKRLEVVVAKDRREDGKGDLVLVKLPHGLSVPQAVEQLSAESTIEFAEPNYLATLNGEG